jgi:hypothetical protein
MRDAISANLISQISNKENTFGCDCAFLLETSNNENKDGQYIAFSFGRSGYDSELRDFATQISKSLNLPLVEINWLKKGTSTGDLINHIKVIKNATFTITDIYHFSITSWREKTPCLCIGKGSSYPKNTLSDKKKEILYMQHFASHNYCYVEKVLEKNQQYTEECISNITNSKSNQLIFESIEKQRTKAINLLLENLKI